jgi:RNA polymerase sigma-70 factor (ECF subfamily)
MNELMKMIKSLSARDEEKMLSRNSHNSCNSCNIEEIYERHYDMLYRVCFSYLKNREDTKDAVSEIFLKLIQTKQTKKMNFQNAEHEKAWLLRVSINLCKNLLKHKSRKNENIDDYADLESENPFKEQEDETLKIIMEMPERYKYVIHLYYYEGYASKEIAKILKKPHSTIRCHLQEARKYLKGVLENEENDENDENEENTENKK